MNNEVREFWFYRVWMSTFLFHFFIFDNIIIYFDHIHGLLPFFVSPLLQPMLFLFPYSASSTSMSLCGCPSVFNQGCLHPNEWRDICRNMGKWLFRFKMLHHYLPVTPQGGMVLPKPPPSQWWNGDGSNLVWGFCRCDFNSAIDMPCSACHIIPFRPPALHSSFKRIR